MIQNGAHKSKKGTPYVWASELHKALGLSSRFRDWFPKMLAYDFEERVDVVFNNDIRFFWFLPTFDHSIIIVEAEFTKT